MKICACIVEYNPLHLGHIKHIEYMKSVLGAEKIIAIMSGNFTQRGEPAVLDKFTRARHAILAGVDLVIELPTVFATANAETFANGAINLINDLGVCDGLCFGVESGDASAYIALAKAMNNETKEFKKLLKENLEKGISLAKAKFETVKAFGGEFNEALIGSPNNILGLEYTKAIYKRKSKIEIFPMLRQGNHNDTTLKKGITSASSIRRIIKTGEVKKLKKNLPKFVYQDLRDYPFAFDKIVMSKLITTPANILAQSPDCTEGLENRIKALSKDNRNIETLVGKVTTKRYTETRIRRILTANTLNITQDAVLEYLKVPLYAKVLAVNKESMDLISLLSQKSEIPLITRKSDTVNLKKSARKCFETDVLANDLYNLITEDNKNENHMIII